MHDVEVEVREGRLHWSYQDVYKLIAPFPKTGHLDTVREFQDDEIVLEEGEAAFDEEASEEPSAVADDDSEESEGELDDDDLLADEEEATGSLVQAEDAQNQEPLSAEAADASAAHGARMDALRQALDVVASLNDPSLTMTLQRAMHTAERSERLRLSSAPAVAGAMMRQRDLQEQRLREERRELKERMDEERAAKALKTEMKENEAKLAKAKKQLKDAQSVAESFEAIKSFSPEMLGDGKKGGGTAQHRKARMEVLDRLGTHGTVSAQQRNDWQWFKEEWDKEMSAQKGETWGATFAEAVQSVMLDLRSGKSSAVSEFMYTETKRVLSHVPVLRV